MTAEVAAAGHLEPGTATFRRANWALFAAAFSTFASLYGVQPLLTIFAEQFGLGADGSSLALSLTTATLGVAIVLAGSLSDAIGRKRLMFISLILAALLNLLVALAPNWPLLLASRAMMGLALCGIPATAMAYIAEEFSPKATGFAMGLYIGGSAIGGMAGRLLIGVVADIFSWRVAVGLVGVVVLVSAVLMRQLLQESRHFHAKPFRPDEFLPSLARVFVDPGLRWLYAVGFLLMGGFITVFNYLGFRLSAEPYALSHAVIASIFLSYMVGSASSTWAGTLADRIGRRKVLWIMILAMGAGLALTGFASLAVIIAGVVVLTFGYFGAHAVASGWVGRRALGARAQATSVYLFFYYIGSSIVGTLGGWMWNHYAWRGVMVLAGVVIGSALGIAIRLYFLQPLTLPADRAKVSPVAAA